MSKLVQPLQTATQQNWFLPIVATVATVQIILIALWHFNVEPFHSFFNPLYATLANIGADFASSLNMGGMLGGLTDKFNADPIGTFAAVGIPVITGMFAISNWVSKKRAENANIALQEDAQNTINQLDNQYKQNLAAVQTKLDGVTALEEKITDLETRLEATADFDNILQQKETELTKLRNQQELLNKQLQDKEDELAAGAKIIEKVITK